MREPDPGDGANSLSYEAAAKRLGVRYNHVVRLLRDGRLALSRDRKGISESSLEAYEAHFRPPSGHVSAAVAADRLGISRRHVPRLLEAGLLGGARLPNVLGGTWLRTSEVESLSRQPFAIAALGIKIQAPPSWLSSADACARLGCSRSSLRWLVRIGLIEQFRASSMNCFYKEADVERQARSQE